MDTMWNLQMDPRAMVGLEMIHGQFSGDPGPQDWMCYLVYGVKSTRELRPLM